MRRLRWVIRHSAPVTDPNWKNDERGQQREAVDDRIGRPTPKVAEHHSDHRDLSQDVENPLLEDPFANVFKAYLAHHPRRVPSLSVHPAVSPQNFELDPMIQRVITR